MLLSCADAGREKTTLFGSVYATLDVSFFDNETMQKEWVICWNLNLRE